MTPPSGALQQHVLQLAPEFNFAVDAIPTRMSKFPALQDELNRHTSAGTYIWQFSRNPPALPALPLVLDAAATPAPAAAPAPTGSSSQPEALQLPAEQPVPSTLPSREQLTEARDALQFAWLVAPVLAGRLPGSRGERRPPGHDAKVFAPYELLQEYHLDYSHAPSLASRPGADAAHTQQKCQPVLVRGSIQWQL